jgi:hypothetical protein
VILYYTYANTEVPLAVPKNESSKIPIPWQWYFIVRIVTNSKMAQNQMDLHSNL